MTKDAERGDGGAGVLDLVRAGKGGQGQVKQAGFILIDQAAPFSCDVKMLAVGKDRSGKAARARLDPDRSPPDRYTLGTGHIYLYCPKGVARTKLTCDYFDRTLACTTTMRNWRTMTKLGELLRGS